MQTKLITEGPAKGVVRRISFLGAALGALIVAGGILGSVTPAQAQEWRREEYHDWRWRDVEWRRHHPGYYAPPIIAAPPPQVVYEPPPLVVAPPPILPGVRVILPIRIR